MRSSTRASACTDGVPEHVHVEREFSVPLDHSRPDGATITVFAREVATTDGRDLPFLVFFQGGPGFEASRPTASPVDPPWLTRALRDYRVLFVDERGTGRSSPVGSLAGLNPTEQASYLVHFRADSIVRDAEAIRGELGVDQWSVLGQSFGGFCVVAYLSLAPGGLREALITGGLPPLGLHTDEVYLRTYPRVLDRNRRYYARYPGDRRRVLELHRLIERGEIVLPSGDVLTARRFKQLGLLLGMSDGAEKLHYLLERPPDSNAFRHDLEHHLPFARNPIFAILHESCYADGCATRWSAERLRPAEFDAPELFTGEHVFPWMFEDYGGPRPLREVAELLAANEWPRLYDVDQLARNDVPVAAAVYVDDMYVDFELSQQTATRIRGLRAWVTDDHQHNGLDAAGEEVFDRLVRLSRGT